LVKPQVIPEGAGPVKWDPNHVFGFLRWLWAR